MSRIHATLIALVISAGATGVVYAGVATAHLGQASAASTVPAKQLAARQAKLAAWRHSLKAALAKRPPALPKLPHFAPVHVQAAAAPAAPVVAAVAPHATVKPHVTYVKPPPVVKYEPAPATTTTTTTTTSSWSDDGDDDGDHGGHDGGHDGGGDH